MAHRAQNSMGLLFNQAIRSGRLAIFAAIRRPSVMQRTRNKKEAVGFSHGG